MLMMFSFLGVRGRVESDFMLTFCCWATCQIDLRADPDHMVSVDERLAARTAGGRGKVRPPTVAVADGCFSTPAAYTFYTAPNPV